MNALLAHGRWAGEGPGPLGWTFFALLVVGIVAGVIALASWLAAGRGQGSARPPSLPSGSGEDPLTILRLRYARGEISREEFLRASEDLGEAPPPPPTAA
jgi:uncharacterized membrane protein